MDSAVTVRDLELRKSGRSPTESEVINEYAFKTGRGRLLHVVQCAVALQLGAFNNTEGMGVNLPLGTNVNGRLKCGGKTSP